MNNASFINPDMRQVSMVGTRLENTNFLNAKLNDADFSQSQQYRTNFLEPELRGIKLAGAVLSVFLLFVCDFRIATESFAKLRYEDGHSAEEDH